MLRERLDYQENLHKVNRSTTSGLVSAYVGIKYIIFGDRDNSMVKSCQGLYGMFINHMYTKDSDECWEISRLIWEIF